MQNQDAQAALQSMRSRMMMPENEEDPGTVLAHNTGVNHPATPAGVLAAAGTARNLISPSYDMKAIWQMLFGPPRQGYIQGGPEATGLATNPEGQ